MATLSVSSCEGAGKKAHQQVITEVDVEAPVAEYRGICPVCGGMVACDGYANVLKHRPR